MLGAVLAGGFLGGLAENMKENREYVRQKSDAMQEYLWKAGLDRQQEVKKERNTLTTAVDYLDSKGMNKNKINALLENDPRELLRLTRTAMTAEETGPVTGDMLDSSVDLSADYEESGMTPSELIKSATVEFVEAGELRKPEQVQKNMLQKIFGATDTEEIMYDVYSSDIMGRKGADIQASISAPILKRRVGDTVTTDLSKFQQLEGSDILQVQRELVDEYDTLLLNSITRLKTKAAKAQVDQNTAEVTRLQKEVDRLEAIQDIDSSKERFNKMLVEQSVGFNTAQQYFDQYPEIFRDQPIFINQNLLPFVSGEEEYDFTTTSSEPLPETLPLDDDNVVEYPDIKITQGQDPLKKAEQFFRRRRNKGETILDVIMPDGSTKTFIKKDGIVKEKP
tara:strand:- start:3514 stop:4695 length:1182 start_codon:yes stop_codon:yes gene_type:complete